jgi:hypothetical protein
VKAEELTRQLSNDPHYLAMREEQEQRLAALRQECADDERLLVSEIRALGYPIDSVWDLVNNAPHPVLERRFTGDYRQAYGVLCRHLFLKHHPRIREGIIRALIVKDGGELVEEALHAAFEVETDDEVRWLLATALRSAMPYQRRRKNRAIAQALAWTGSVR